LLPIELIAVHISDGVLSNFWHGIGFVAAIVLIFAGSWRLQDREIASLALLTTIFFLASSLRVPLGPSSVHLLLNGLLGILIGMRSSIAIAIGLVLQCLLAGHGGVTTLGINICAITIPAYLGCYFYYIGLRVSSYFPKATKFILVFSAILFWGFSVVFGIELFYLRLNGIV
jgi:cobalt/nickel transport system permease protein